MIFSLLILAALSAAAQDNLGQKINDLESKTGIYPDPALTPGEIDPKVSQNNIKTTICKHGYTNTVRNVPESLKKEVFEEYGVKDHFGDYEIDHFISLELGGSNAIKNLWPQSYKIKYNARKKDVVETWLSHQVCAGKIKLSDAQKQIAEDWLKIYKQRSGK